MDDLPKEVLSYLLAYATSDYRDRATLLRLRLVSHAINEIVATDSALSLRKAETRFFDIIAHAPQADGGHDVRPVLAIGDDGHVLSVARYPQGPDDTSTPGRRVLARYAKCGGWYCVTRTDKLYTNSGQVVDSQPYVHLELRTEGVDDKGRPVPSLIAWSRMAVIAKDEHAAACDPMSYATGVSSWSCTTSRGLRVSVDAKHFIIEGGGRLRKPLKFDDPYWITSRVSSTSMQRLCSYISVAAYHRFDYENLVSKTKRDPVEGEARQDVIAELSRLCQRLGDEDIYRSAGWYGEDAVYASPLELKHASGIVH